VHHVVTERSLVLPPVACAEMSDFLGVRTHPLKAPKSTFLMLQKSLKKGPPGLLRSGFESSRFITEFLR
jgi:hypothetical protein